MVRTVVKWRIIGSLRNDHSSWLKNELIFYLRISWYPKVMYFLSRCQNISKLNMEHCVKLEKEVWKNNRRHSRSPENANLGHFTLFTQIYAKKFTKTFYPRVQPLFCLLNLLFRVVPVAVAVAVAVVVFLNSVFKSALYVFCYWSFPGPFVSSRLSCFASLLRKYVFHVKHVKRKVGLLRHIGIAG